MSTGELLTRWTVRIAVTCYLLRVLLDAGRADVRKTDQSKQRLVWTIGCGFYLVHVACAFHFFHGWSQAAALKHTAETTERVVGWYWSGGLWVNYAFTLFWVADVLLWWIRPALLNRNTGAYFWTVHGIFAFLMFNATAVFGPTFWIGITIGYLLLLGLVRFRLRRQLV